MVNTDNNSPGFFARLKQHHIYRVVAAYAVGAWIVMQAATRVFPYFGWSRAVPILIIILLLGFPVVLVIAWMLIKPTDPAKQDSWQRRHWKLGAALSVAVVILVVISGFYAWRFSKHHTQLLAMVATNRPTAVPVSASSVPPVSATTIPTKSIAVLPFENLSSDKNNAYFASGMQDMILTKLADIGDLKVIARTSTAKYASHPDNLKIIAQQLGVATLLEGSVQKSGNQVLINVQLIDANTDNHLWAEAYQRNLHNIFDVEGEVAQQVALALNARLSQTETARLGTAPTQNPQAYDSFLRAEYDANRAYANFKTPDFEAAVRNYSTATQQDSKFLLAWSRLAQMQSLMAWTDSPVLDVNRKQLAAQAKQSARRAEDLAPQSAEAQMAQGWYRLYVLTDLNGALSAFQAAMELEPQNAEALYGVGTTYYHLGRFDASAETYQKAAVLDPRNLNILSQLAHTYEELRRYGQAEQVIKQMLAIDPASLTATINLANVHILAGDLDGAQAVLDAAPASVQVDFRYSLRQVELMLCRRDYTGARHVLLSAVPEEHTDLDRGQVEEDFGDVEWAAGNHEPARAHYQRAAMLLEAALMQSPERARGDLSWVYARLGRTQEALAQAQLFLKDRQAAKSVQREEYALANLAAVQAQIGQVDEAITGLDRLLAMPTGEFISVPLLKMDPTWDPIRKDPRFQALLKKYEKFQTDVIPAPAISTSAENGHG